MKPKLLVAALAAAGMISSGTAYGLSLNPTHWFHSDHAAQSDSSQKLAQADQAKADAQSGNAGAQPTRTASAASSAEHTASRTRSLVGLVPDLGTASASEPAWPAMMRVTPAD